MATKQKVFSRSLIRSKKFWQLSSDQCRLFYLLVQLDLDNIGRSLGNKYYLKGKLYEKIDHITPERCEEFLNECGQKGLLIHYEIDGNFYIQDPVHLEHNKIIGNMKAESVYPAPPKEVVEKWEEATKQNYTLLDKIKQSLAEDKDKDKDKDKEEDKGKDKDIVTDFNLVFGTNYKPTTPKTKELIRARLNEGFSLEDFKIVHRKMLKNWGADAKMYKYLRPQTLYSPKFESYLNMREQYTKLTEAGIKAYLIGQEWLREQGEDAK